MPKERPAVPAPGWRCGQCCCAAPGPACPPLVLPRQAKPWLRPKWQRMSGQFCSRVFSSYADRIADVGAYENQGNRRPCQPPSRTGCDTLMLANTDFGDKNDGAVD